MQFFVSPCLFSELVSSGALKRSVRAEHHASRGPRGAAWPTGWHPSCVPQLFAAMTGGGRVEGAARRSCSCKVHENVAHSRAWTARIPHTQSVE